MTRRLLVTGGAGYIGGITARHLADRGWAITTLDDLSSGHRDVAQGTFIHGDLRDRHTLDAAFAKPITAVLHFAGRSLVGASVRDPLPTWQANLGGTLSLLDAMRRHGCRHVVFSSSCAVHGAPAEVPISEQAPIAPISPYGACKAAIERLLSDLRAAGALHAVSLRYFNAAGATADGALGERHDPETHLIPLALRSALADAPLQVFGLHHPTPDGSCVRDYVHVEDLADAHGLALDALLEGRAAPAYNLGAGVGTSVLELIQAIEEVTGAQVPWRAAPARPGDPPILVADASLARRELGWRPRRDLRQILRDAARWEARSGTD